MHVQQDVRISLEPCYPNSDCNQGNHAFCRRGDAANVSVRWLASFDIFIVLLSCQCKPFLILEHLITFNGESSHRFSPRQRGAGPDRYRSLMDVHKTTHPVFPGASLFLTSYLGFNTIEFVFTTSTLPHLLLLQINTKPFYT